MMDASRPLTDWMAIVTNWTRRILTGMTGRTRCIKTHEKTASISKVTYTVLYQLRYQYGGKCNDDFNHCITISSRFYIQLHRLTGTTTNKNNKIAKSETTERV